MQEVIRIEPRAAPAWSVLAQCYSDMDQGQRALQLRIMAAHLRHDAEEWDRLARLSRYVVRLFTEVSLLILFLLHVDIRLLRRALPHLGVEIDNKTPRVDEDMIFST